MTELTAVIELRWQFPLITDNEQARALRAGKPIVAPGSKGRFCRRAGERRRY
jgi:hypothetical protein